MATKETLFEGEVVPTEGKQESRALVANNPYLGMVERWGQDPNFDVAKMRAMMDMAKEWQAEQARLAFAVAKNDFKRNLPTIEKTKPIVISREANAKPAYYYAPLDEVCEKIIPALNAVGIEHCWSTTYEGEWMVVTCTLTHELGHKESTSMRGCADKTGSKNAIQAEGSTLSYLERYTLCSICGIAIKGLDTDGAVGSVGEQWLKDQIDEIGRCETSSGLTNAYKKAAAEALNARDMNAYHKLQSAYGARKQAIA
jgi:ERF superfamily